MNRFQLIAAAFTPMHDDGSVNLAAIPGIVDFVLGQGGGGVDGLFLCGSTGEFSSLTLAERMDVTAAYHAAAAGRCKLFAHVGSNSIPESMALAEQAAELQIDAMGYAPPSYFRPANVAAVAQCLQQVASAAPQTPLYYYHIPPLTRVDIRVIDLLPLMDQAVPSFAGVKFSYPQFDDLARCVHYQRTGGNQLDTVCPSGERYEMLFGADEMLLAGMAIGAVGAVGSTYNFWAQHYRQIIDAYADGNMQRAQQFQSKVSTMVHDVLQFGGMNAIKATMTCSGLDVGPPRLPLQPLPSEKLDQLAEVLRAVPTA